MTENSHNAFCGLDTRLGVVFLLLALEACASTRPEPGSLAALKEAQFMPIYHQCLRDRAPLRPNRGSYELLAETAKACMKMAKAAVQ